MIRDEKLSLPENWEMLLEQLMLKNPSSLAREQAYICSPCRSDTADGVIRNMKAARVYMFYVYIHFAALPKAPHAYLPVLLNDKNEFERALALDFGKQLLDSCNRLYVCGDKLSEGMYGEVTTAISMGIAVEVFNPAVSSELCARFVQDGIGTENVWYDEQHLHLALTWGTDELAAYWGGDNNA